MKKVLAKPAKPEKVEETLDDKLDEQGFSADPFWDNIDTANTVVIDANLPTDAYNPARVVNMAKAYREIELQNKDSNEYKKHQKIIDNFQKTIKKIEEDIKEAKAAGKDESVKELECTKNYMISFDEKAIDLSRRVGNAFKDNHERVKLETDDYNTKKEKETTRWKKKNDNIKRDKDEAIAQLKLKNSIIQDAGGQFIKIAPSICAAIAAYNIPGKEYVKLGLAVLIGVGTYVPLSKLVDYWETSKVHKITDKFEPRFEKSDADHEEAMAKIEKYYRGVMADVTKENKERYGNMYRRAIAETVREASRYFPDAVIIAKKSGSPEQVNTEVKDITSRLEKTLTS